jgi:CHASE2 domain-containing sensor protein
MTKTDLANIVILPVIGAVAAAAGTLLLQQLWIPGLIASVIALGFSYLFWIVIPE